MKTNEIIAGNRLLAEFMGIEPAYNSFTGGYSWSDGIFFSTNHGTREKVMQSIVSYAKHHSSWDRLMPVVEKIENLDGGGWFKFGIYEKNCSIRDIASEYTLIRRTGSSKIESAWLACVEFVKWWSE